EAFPSHAALQNNLAVLKELAGDLAGAEDVVRAARKNEPSLPQLSKNLGDLAYRASRYDEAWEAYRRAVELAPDLGDDVYFKLGNIAYKRNERELAAQLWRQALEINPKHELGKANLDTLGALSGRRQGGRTSGRFERSLRRSRGREAWRATATKIAACAAASRYGCARAASTRSTTT